MVELDENLANLRDERTEFGRLEAGVLVEYREAIEEPRQDEHDIGIDQTEVLTCTAALTKPFADVVIVMRG